MNENENIVGMQNEEVVAEPTAQPEKKYTDAELDEILGRKIARKEAKIRKEYEAKYGHLEEVLKAGTGKDSLEELTTTFEDFYAKKGIAINKKPSYSNADIEVLAKADADYIINGGLDEVVEEVDRLSALGVENMNAREKAVFKTLAEYRLSAERGNELSRIGAKADTYNSKEFNDFAKKFSSKTPISEIYEIFEKTQPKKTVKTMGSMKNATSNDSAVKDFYTREEALQFTTKDFDKNPELYKAVRNSMLKW